ncbi:MAG TPA: class I SAM-dependent methyltransferase [Pyrinomonadaceae bacterium]|nr:class I SAM-dependent methyltransferase [Pyrinomonadaceae bacterium]
MGLANTGTNYAGFLDLTLQKARYSLRRRFSHLNEEQILKHYIDQFVPQDSSRTIVDIGAGNGVRWSNSYALVLEGWKALGIEADPGKYELLSHVYEAFPNARACRRRVQPQHINELLAAFGIERDFSVLCLDVDGNDYWILNAILSQYRPRLIVTEINEKIPPPIRFVVKYDENFRLRHHFYGYSISALEDLCRRHSYGILRLEYNNAFIAPLELGGEFINAESAYDNGYRNRTDRRKRFALNFDVDAVLSMPPERAIEFMRQFYKKDEGNYYLGLSPDIVPRSLEQEEPEMAQGQPVQKPCICPICRTDVQPEKLAEATLGDADVFDLVECVRCKTRYMSPLPSVDQLKRFYQPQYYGADWFKQRGLGRALAQLELNRLPPGNFLDIGCGLGFFIDGIRSNSNWRVYGVELTAPAVEFATRELKLDVSTGEMSKLEYPDQFFDYIQMHNVLEHVRDPMGLLRECRRILKPSGKLYLRVPNGTIDSRNLLKFFGDRNEAPFSKSGHLYFFPKSALVWMFDQVGLEIQDASTYGIRRGLAALGLWPQFRDWKRHYVAKPFSSNGGKPRIELPPEKPRPNLYYRYRMVRMNSRMLSGMRDFGLDYQFVLTAK